MNKESGEQNDKSKGISVQHCEIVSNIYKEDGSCYWTPESIAQVLIAKKDCIEKYSYIVHDKDTYTEEDEKKNPSHKCGMLKPPHIHLLLRFHRDQIQNTYYIAKWFSLPNNFVSRIKSKWNDAIKYQLHLNAPTKYQYSFEEVFSNFDFNKAIEKIEKNEQKKNEIEIVNELLVQILNGTIREYNKTVEIDNLLLVKYASKFREAFKVRLEYLQATVKERHLECIFITGCSGSGKTTLAKEIAKSRNLDFFVSSGSNDVLDGYKQEPVIILDDIRPSAMGLSDFLKFLDNHTASTVKSRYTNKYIHAELIILTTVLDMNTFFSNVFTEGNEPITQLRRRCGTYIKMDLKHIDISIWDDAISSYTNHVTYENHLVKTYVSQTQKTATDVYARVESWMPFLKRVPTDDLAQGFEKVQDFEELPFPILDDNTLSNANNETIKNVNNK